jgi:uncharacterized iron-regulated protein
MTRSRLFRALFLVLCAVPAAASALAAQDRSLHLPVGDPARREKEAALVLDAVTDTRTGDLLTPADLAARLAGVQLVVVGEEHTAMESHRVQLRVIQELHRAGRKVLIGLEMFPASEQRPLDQWHRGLLTEEGFVELARWYTHWGYNWGYYRDIFLFAREAGIPLFAVNAPRDVVTAVRQKGYASLTEEQRRYLPEKVDAASEEHRTLFRSYFEEDDPLHAMKPEEMEGMVSAQATWDAAMAHNTLRALREHGGPINKDVVMVVLAGVGHVAYGLGIQRQAVAQGFQGRAATVIPVAVGGTGGEPLSKVQASYADFLWGVAAEIAPLYPSLGLSTSGGDGEPRKVIFLNPGSAAEKAGFQAGDLILALDGAPIQDRETYNRALAAKRWGDSARFSVRRAEKTLELTALFRRSPEGD